MHQVGVGVLGPVFRTYDPDRDRLVAVKAFQLDLVPEQIEVFVGALKRVVEVGPAHVGVVSPLGAGVEEGIPYLAQEYVATESLDLVIRQEAPLQPRRVLSLVRQVAAAIDAAHGVGIVHGAMHLRDVFVSPEITRATGFGVGSALEHVGLKVPIRPPYTAPEIVAGRRWGPEADRFSVAAITYELLTGRRAAGTGDEVLGRLVEFDTADVADPVGLQQAFRNALADDPEIRPVSATGFVSALANAVGIDMDAESDDTDVLDRDGSSVTLAGEPAFLSESAESEVALDKSESHDDDLVAELEVVAAEEEPIRSSRNTQEDLFDWEIDKPERSDDESDAVAGAELGVTEPDVGLPETSSDPESTDSDEARLGVAPAENEDTVQVNVSNDLDASSRIVSAEPETTQEVATVIESVADATSTLDTDRQAESVAEEVEMADDVVSRKLVESVPTGDQINEEAKQTFEATDASNGLSEESFPEVEQAAFSGLAGDAPFTDEVKDDVMPGPMATGVPPEQPATAFLRGKKVSPVATTSSRKVVPVAIAVVIGVVVAYLVSIGLGGGGGSVNNGVGNEASSSPVETTPQVAPVMPIEQQDVDANDTGTSEVASEEASEGMPLGTGQSQGQDAGAFEREQATQLTEEPETITELIATGQETSQVSDSADAEFGWLLVRTEPPGAVVSVDGEVRGDSPISIADVSYGTYRLVVAAEGYQSVERVVTVTADQRIAAVSIPLVAGVGGLSDPSSQIETEETNALVGRLFVDSRPPGAAVFVDATQVGVTPLLIPDVTVGSHRVRIEGTGYLPWTTTVTIESNGEVRVAASLEPGVRR